MANNLQAKLPQGTRDFGPLEVGRRQHIFKTLETEFKRYGFQPIETPAMELLSTLAGKYGEEGDRLIFKILNNGLNEESKRAKVEAGFAQILEGKSNYDITERALRYDLTIPFARFVVANQQQLAFPFKRYQMQPVWRADRPQKGRYREFWQCDCDVIGSKSLLYEAELLCIYQSAFTALRIPDVQIKISSRALLFGLAQWLQIADQFVAFTTILDKLDKIEWDGVRTQLQTLGISEAQLDALHALLTFEGDANTKLHHYAQILSGIEQAEAGIADLKTILDYQQQLQLASDTDAQIVIDITLARGLNYYTGMIVECTTNAVKMGSIGGGGRYDDLTGLFGLKDMSGVGVSFGIDRIYDVMAELELFPDNLQSQAKLLFTLPRQTNDEMMSYILRCVSQARKAGIDVELYPEPSKLDKQLKFANKKGFQYIAIIDEQELASQTITLKDFVKGTQVTVDINAAINNLLAQ